MALHQDKLWYMGACDMFADLVKMRGPFSFNLSFPYLKLPGWLWQWLSQVPKLLSTCQTFSASSFSLSRRCYKIATYSLLWISCIWYHPLVHTHNVEISFLVKLGFYCSFHMIVIYLILFPPLKVKGTTLTWGL